MGSIYWLEDAWELGHLTYYFWRGDSEVVRKLLSPGDSCAPRAAHLVEPIKGILQFG